MSTTAQLSENSHQGFEGIKAALCLASIEVKSNIASGMPLCLRQNGIGSRSSGKERDQETGLDYFGARYYSGAQGRFTSVDPIAGLILNPQSFNRYAYALNNPLKFIDPTGMVVVWADEVCDAKGCKSKGRDSYLKRLNEMVSSKDAKESQKGTKLKDTYGRLDQSKATFEVVDKHLAGENKGSTGYNGNNHFAISVQGDDKGGLTRNQMFAHEFEHGRQVLDNEIGFEDNNNGVYSVTAHDAMDEVNGFQAGFDIEPAAPGQNKAVNDLFNAMKRGGAYAGQYVKDHFTSYKGLPSNVVNVPNPPPPNVYQVPK